MTYRSRGKKKGSGFRVWRLGKSRLLVAANVPLHIMPNSTRLRVENLEKRVEGLRFTGYAYDSIAVRA